MRFTANVPQTSKGISGCRELEYCEMPGISATSLPIKAPGEFQSMPNHCCGSWFKSTQTVVCPSDCHPLCPQDTSEPYQQGPQVTELKGRSLWLQCPHCVIHSYELDACCHFGVSGREKYCNLKLWFLGPGIFFFLLMQRVVLCDLVPPPSHLSLPFSLFSGFQLLWHSYCFWKTPK
jgi:hypothetical protein